MNHWVMAFPYLMYLASVGTCSSPSQAGGDTLTDTTDVALGIANIYYDLGLRYYTITATDISTSYFSVCLSLNVLLTLMIVLRLAVHIRNVRKVTGASDGSSGLHTVTATVVVMLIESYALYAGVLLAYTIPWAMESWVTTLFAGVLGPVQVRVFSTVPNPVLVWSSNYGCLQVIAPYLIILRVAKQRAMTSESVSGTVASIRFRSQVSTDGGGSLLDEGLTNSTEVNVEAPGELGAGAKCAIEEVPL